MRGWIGVDFDATLSHYDKWVDSGHVGPPIEPMVQRVQQWLAEGREVRIFTARIWPLAHVDTAGGVGPLLSDYDKQRIIDAHRAVSAVVSFCQLHIGERLMVTCVKDMGMIELWDDRAVTVEANTGRPLVSSTRGLGAVVPKRHRFWGAGEASCPADLKAANGELVDMRCKDCGEDWKRISQDVCFGGSCHV